MLVYILQGLTYGLAGAAQPGAFQAYVISRALEQGWRRTLPMALAPLVSDTPILILVLLVLSTVPPWFGRVLSIVGGLFILYLAWSAYRAFRAPATDDPPAASAQQGLFRAALMNLISPGPYLFWSLVAGPVFLAGWREAPPQGIAFLVAFYASMIVTLGGIICLFGAARALGQRVVRALMGLSAVALAGFGLYQLAQGIGLL